MMSGVRLSQGDQKFRVTIMGGGRIGTALALILSQAPEFAVTLADPTEPARDRARELDLPLLDIDPSDHGGLDRLLRNADAVVAAMPAGACLPVAEAAKRHGTHYLDLNEDSAIAEKIAEIGRSASRSFVPQCGISPGLISQLTLDFANRTPGAREVQIRIGILPRHSTNRLGYALTWDINGLIAEYTRPSMALRDGRPVELRPLSDREVLHIDGCRYEAFVSGSVPKSLCQRLEGRIDTLMSKTIRYPGHLDYIHFLLDDLRLRERQDILCNILRNALPELNDDQVLMLISVREQRQTRGTEAIWWKRIVPARIGGALVSATRRTAASHVAAVLDLLRTAELPLEGLVAQEDIPLARLRENRFLGWVFSEEGRPAAAA